MEKRHWKVACRSRALAICELLNLGYPGEHDGAIVTLEMTTDAVLPKLPSEKPWRKGQSGKLENFLIVIALSQPKRLSVRVNRTWDVISVCVYLLHTPTCTHAHAACTHALMHTCTCHGCPQCWIWTFTRAWQIATSRSQRGLPGRCSARELRAPGLCYRTP